MYGLIESGRCWYITVDLFLREKGCSKLDSDPACWIYQTGGRFHGFICLHVDDGIMAGSGKFHENVQTRPDASFACLVLNCNQLNPTWRDVKTYNAAVNAIKNNPYDLVMRKLEPNKWKVSVFSDASHGNLPPDGTGTGGGYIIFLSNGYIKGEKNRCNVLTWKCAKIRKACTSTTEAETIQLNDAILEAEMIKEILAPEGLIEIEAFCDNRNAVFNLKSLTIKEAQFPIRMYIKRMKDLMDEGYVKKVEEIGDSEQIADNLSKLTGTRMDLIQTLKQGRFFH